MRFDGLDLNLLVALEALIEERHVSAAARRLHLTQPAVTGALKRLREYFEDDLLVQRGRQMFLSPKAESLAEPVRNALLFIRAEITKSGSFNPLTSTRRFIIGASDYAYAILLADVIAEAEKLAPNTSFVIVQPGEAANEGLERAEIDLILTLNVFASPDHQFKELWRDQEVIVSWEGAGYDQIDAETFFSNRHVIATFGQERRPTLADMHIANLKHKRKVSVILPNFGLLCQAIVGTRRLATLHRLYAHHFMNVYPIKVHPTWEPFPEIIEGMQWHSVKDQDPGVLWLTRLLQDKAKELKY